MKKSKREAGTLDREMAKRLQDALIGGVDELFQVMQDPEPDVLRAALKNPHLCESHLQSLLRRRDLQDDLLKSIGNSRYFKESHLLQLALARHPSTSASQLMRILPYLYLFDLLMLCALPGATSDQKIAAERALIQRLPTATLGDKITIAQRATAAVAEVLLKEADPRIMAACLDNPRLREGAVFKFLHSAAANPETISMIARHTRWQNRPNLKQAVLSNPRTPLIWFTHWMSSMKIVEVRKLYESQRLSQMQRREVLAELKSRGWPD